MTALDGAKLKRILTVAGIEFEPSMSHKIFNTCQAIWIAAQAEQKKRDAEIVEGYDEDDRAVSGRMVLAAAILAQED